MFNTKQNPSLLYYICALIAIFSLSIVSFFGIANDRQVSAQEGQTTQESVSDGEVADVQIDNVNQETVNDEDVQLISAPAEKTVIYTQTGCPHCEKVEEFVKLNNLEGYILIKDIAKDKVAYDEFTQIYDKNNVAETDRYIPMIVIASTDPEKSDEIINGDTPIIDILISRYGITNPIYEEESSFSVDTNILIVFGSVVAIIFVIYGIYFLVSRKTGR